MELFSIYQNMSGLLFLIIVIALWDLVFKALALWRSAKRDSKIWFICILIFNTAGILPIIYLVISTDFKQMKKESDSHKMIKIEKKQKAIKEITKKTKNISKGTDLTKTAKMNKGKTNLKKSAPKIKPKNPKKLKKNVVS